MKQKQPIYIIEKRDFDLICPGPRSSWVYGRYFGTITCAEEYQDMLDEIKFDKDDTVLVSKAMEAINRRFSWKLIAADKYGRPLNGALIYLKKQLNYVRKPKES